MNPETGLAKEKTLEHVSVKLPANLVNSAREAGVDVEAVCRTALSTAIGLKSNWTAMQRASREVMDKIAGQFKR